MNISVRAFASYREAIGSREIRLDVTAGTTAAQIWESLQARYPRLNTLPRPAAFAINDEYVSAETALREQDELVLIPPVSGGQDESARSGRSSQSTALVEGPIDVAGVLDQVRHPEAGAVVLFLGTVRDNRRGQRVQQLEYEAYRKMALREMDEVASEARRRWPVLRIAMVHRLGVLRVGDISVVIAVSSAHRKEAFEAAKFAIDTLKRSVPIWKKEVWEGGEVWVGSEPTQTTQPTRPTQPTQSPARDQDE